MRMKEASTGPLYDLWSWFYDVTFGALVHKRQERALEQVRPSPGDRVLDLGVGTGMTLPHYPSNVEVVGMDLSAGMLAKAAEKRAQQNLEHCQLVLADAMHVPFADQSFDHIVISHTISVVSDANRLLREAQRLIKPGGRIVVLNHFQSTRPIVAFFEKLFNPVFVKIGWRSDLSLEECLEGVDLHVQYHFKMAMFDFWQIVVLSPESPPASIGEGEAPASQMAARPAGA